MTVLTITNAAPQWRGQQTLTLSLLRGPDLGVTGRDGWRRRRGLAGERSDERASGVDASCKLRRGIGVITCGFWVLKNRRRLESRSWRGTRPNNSFQQNFRVTLWNYPTSAAFCHFGWVPRHPHYPRSPSVSLLCWSETRHRNFISIMEELMPETMCPLCSRRFSRCKTKICVCLTSPSRRYLRDKEMHLVDR